MATKNTKDNTYYSFTKAFHFSSIIVLIAPILLVVWEIIRLLVGYNPSSWVNDAINYTWIVMGVFALIWIVLNIILFVMAGNMRGIKSPLGIRITLLIAMILVLSISIVGLLSNRGVIPELKEPWDAILNISLAVLTMVGFIIGAVLSKKIQKALRN